MNSRKSGLRVALFVALVAAILAISATAALAAPAEPTLGVSALQTKIDANGGSLDGYLKTVVKGSDIATIHVNVLAVTSGFDSGPADMSSLILFEATGATIDKIGGIAAGMSGSPIYVNDGGEYKLIGALSYGDIFTTGGTGLATPIDAMSTAEDAPPTLAPRKLASPVYLDGQVKDRVSIVNDPSNVKSAPANTIVASPMSAVFIGGVNPKSPIYKAYAKYLTSKGIDVIPTQGGLSSVESTYNAPFEAGSAVAVLAARGDLWMGGIGTVTYVDTSTIDPTVVAFGHSAFWEGKTGLFLSNAWIDGIWPSTYEPYKLGRPAAVRGTITDDRMAAVIGVDGLMPEETTITAEATNLETAQVATSAVELPRFVANAPDENGNYYGLAPFSAYIAGSRVFDAYSTPGSAITTTTVTVSDGSQTYVLKRRNIFSDGYDIPSVAVNDVDEMVSEFQSANGNGIAHADIISVDLETEFSPGSQGRKEAEVVDLNVPGGLKTGNNTVIVSLLQYGNPDTQTVNVPLHIPAGVPLSGDLSVDAINNPGSDASSSDSSDSSSMDSSSIDSLFFYGYGFSSGIDRRTVKDVVDELNKEVDNSVIGVSFQPVYVNPNSDSGDGPVSAAPAPVYAAIESTLSTDWVVSSGLTKTAPYFDAYLAEEGTISYGSKTVVLGDLLGVDGAGQVLITGPGISKKVPVNGGSIVYVTPALYKNTKLTLTFLGNDSSLPVQTSVHIYVAAQIGMTASRTSFLKGYSTVLTANVRPKTAGSTVTFQKWNGYMWSTLKTVTVPSSGTATCTCKPTSKGTLKVRAHYNGGSTKSNMAANSNTIKLTVK